MIKSSKSKTVISITVNGIPSTTNDVGLVKLSSIILKAGSNYLLIIIFILDMGKNVDITEFIKTDTSMIDGFKCNTRSNDLREVPLRGTESKSNLIHCNLEECNTIVLGAIPHITYKEQIVVGIQNELRSLYLTTRDCQLLDITHFDVGTVINHLTKHEIVIV